MVLQLYSGGWILGFVNLSDDFDESMDCEGFVDGAGAHIGGGECFCTIVSLVVNDFFEPTQLKNG